MCCKKRRTTCCGCTVCCILCCLLLYFLFQFNPWPFWARLCSPPHVSYNGRIVFNLHDVQTPKSEEDIQGLVSRAVIESRKIRVLGTGHSWSEIAQTEDIMVYLDQFKGIRVNKLEKTVTCRAGNTMKEVIAALDEAGLAMENLDSISTQTVGGIVATGTHGTGYQHKSLSALVTKLRFVNGKGEIVTVSKDDEDPSLFYAAQVSVGMLGIITEITFPVVPKFTLIEYRTKHSLTYCLDNLDSIVMGVNVGYVKLWVDYYNDFCLVFNQTRTSEPPRHHRILLEIKGFLMYYMFAISTRITYLLPCLTKITMCLVDFIGFPLHYAIRVDNSHEILNDYFRLPIHAESGLIVEYKHAVDLISKIKAQVLEKQIPVNYITEFRFVAGDSGWLSPFYSDTPKDKFLTITETIYTTRTRTHEYVQTCYEAAKSYNARLHWGKLGLENFTPSVLSHLYPKYHDFMRVREEMDPKKIFINKLLQDVFLGAGG